MDNIRNLVDMCRREVSKRRTIVLAEPSAVLELATLADNQALALHEVKSMYYEALDQTHHVTEEKNFRISRLKDNLHRVLEAYKFELGEQGADLDNYTVVLNAQAALDDCEGDLK